MNETLEVKIQSIAEDFLTTTKDREIQIISHFDTDGITSAAIIIQALRKLDQKFSIKILKSLTKEDISKLDKEKPTLFLDLASGNLEDIKEAGIKDVYIIDHHEIPSEIPEEIKIINPELHEKQKLSASGLTYLFAKTIDESNKDLAKLAIVGMIGDQLEKQIDKLNNEILKDGEIITKRGLLVYPSTRPLNRVLEYSSDPFIPGVTGNPEGVIELLKESGLGPENGKYKSLLELTEEEMEKLVTSVMLRNPDRKDEIIGNLFLIKMFGKLEDARELSAKINACSRTGHPEIAIAYCMENFAAKKKVESIHIKYKQELLQGIRYAEQVDKIETDNYIIIDGGNTIKDTMIGTITSIFANSIRSEKGKIIIGISEDLEKRKIKISTRSTHRSGRNLREMLFKVMENFEGEVGGHEFAAGCSLDLEHKEHFLEKLQQNLEMEIVQVINREHTKL